jgi:hypothetical protein
MPAPSARPLPSHARSPLARALGQLTAGAATISLGCAFGGYVPSDPPPKPLAPTEADIPDLTLGDAVTGRLDCPAGSCRVRYRIVAPSSGTLDVKVTGPAGDDETGQTGPRLARVVLEGVGQQTLMARTRQDGPPPFEVHSPVERGIHYVLVQGLGGPLEYGVTATFTPGPRPEPEAGSVEDIAEAEPPTTPRVGQPVRREVVPMPHESQAQGDVSDGADYAKDPAFDFDYTRTYAFAQDPAAMLKGKPGSVKGNVFLLRAIQRQIRYSLADLGKNQDDPKQADFLVAVGVGKQSTTWWSTSFGGVLQPYDYYFDLWDRPGTGVSAHTYEDGILQIDFIDPRSGNLLWHGWAVEPIPISGNDDTTIKKAVAKVLGQL